MCIGTGGGTDSDGEHYYFTQRNNCYVDHARALGTLVALAAACGGKATSGSAHDDPSGPRAALETPAIPPPAAPRWVAVMQSDSDVSFTNHLSVVRFDDPERPRSFRLATGSGLQLRGDWVHWSPTGERVAFVTCSETGAKSLWVAARDDEFAPRPIAALSEIGEPDEPGCENLAARGLSWIGADALFLAMRSGYQLRHRT